MTRRRRVPGIRRPKALFLLPAIPDDASDALKNALAVRNQCSVEGRCPVCGAEPEFHVDGHGIGHLTFRHEPGCPCLVDGEAA